MEITSFTLSQDRATLVLNLNDAGTVTNLYLYTKETYKIDAYKVDLSSKLNGQYTQNISITPADLGETLFDGLYFLDMVAGGTTECAIAAELFRYEGCILDEIRDTAECEECPQEIYMKALNLFMMLRSVEISVAHNLVQESLTGIYGLDKFCGECAACGKYKKS